MAEVDPERPVLPALLALQILGAFTIVDSADSTAAAAGMSAGDLADLHPSVDLDSLRAGQTLKLAR